MATGLVGTDIADGVVGLYRVHRVHHLLLLLLLLLRLGRRLLDVDVREADRRQTGVLYISGEMLKKGEKQLFLYLCLSHSSGSSWKTRPGAGGVALLAGGDHSQHLLGRATDLEKDCEEEKKANKVTLVLVEKEAMSSPSSSKMKVVGTAVWLVRSSTCSVHLITMSRWVLVNHPKVAADLPGLVLHQGDVEPLEGGRGELPGKRNDPQKSVQALEEPVRLNRVSGDCDKVAMSFEGCGEGPEEAGGHGQEVALLTKESDEVLDDLENLIKDQHSVEPVERG